jgi:hypothetical protein
MSHLRLSPSFVSIALVVLISLGCARNNEAHAQDAAPAPDAGAGQQQEQRDARAGQHGEGHRDHRAGNNRQPRVEGSGVLKSEPRDVEAFTQLTIQGAMDAKVTIGQQQSVTVEADDNILPLIETKVDGDKLLVSSTGRYNTKNPIRLTITVPSFKGVAINGSGDVDVSGLNGESFATAINGSGDVTATGTAESVSVAIHGSGDVRLDQLQAKNGKVAVAGSGDVTINASDELKVSIAGSGDVKYMGSPKVTRSVAGSGSVRKAG